MIWKGLERFSDLGLLILRLGVGLGFFWYHGWPKLIGGPERWAGVGGSMANLGLGGLLDPVVWGFLAAAAESVGALLFAVGLFFRPMSLVLALTMVVAGANHLVTGQGTEAHAVKNVFFFVGLMGVGAGRYSVDHIREQKRSH
jgi:putative oxidoreductase